MMDVKGKNVVISGGLSGIGLGVCKALMSSNISSLTILDIVENPLVINELKTINSTVKVLFIKTDVTSEENVETSFDKIISEFKTIDIVICNAGMANENEKEMTVQVNFMGVMYMTLVAMDLMSKSKGKSGGIIMATSSLAGIGGKCFCSPVYSATKHAIIGFYRSLSHKFYYNKHNIKFLLICPGQTITPLMENLVPNIFDPEALETTMELVKDSPMQHPDIVGRLMVDALKIGENGSAWIIDDGKLSQIEFTEYSP